MYTIPGNVQAEAKKALNWHAENHRGGTPVGLNTARTLAKGGQIGLAKIRHIAKYFPRHEVDKKANGWDLGEDNFPSNGRIAWALWGGDGAQRWSSTIVERENKKALAAGGYFISGNPTGVVDPNDFESVGSEDIFVEVHYMEPGHGPEFMARVRLDGSGIDRLYKIEIDGRVYLWDGDSWDNMGHVDGDVYTYDESLDDQYDRVEKDHVIIDASSAVMISALLKQTPYSRVSIEDLDELEAQLAADALPELDLELVDRVITAASTPTTTTPTISDTSKNTSDGYTSSERSANVAHQTRDATGRFATTGSRVVVGGDKSNGSGVITNVNKDNGMVTVQLDNGKSIDVGAKYTQGEGTLKSDHIMPQPSEHPLDVSGILGKPRMPQGYTGAKLPGTMAPLSSKDIHDAISNWPKYVSNMRSSYKPLTKGDITKYAKEVLNKGIRPGGPSIQEINQG
jgi:hypothetical protein